MFLDVRATVIDEMHVVHAGRTRRHARQARQTSIEVFDDGLARRLVLLQHVLDERDPAARAIELITHQYICGTRGRTEPAMHALAQDAFGMRDGRIGELLWAKFRTHRELRPLRQAAGIQNPVWIERMLDPCGQIAELRRQRLKCLDPRAQIG